MIVYSNTEESLLFTKKKVWVIDYNLYQLNKIRIDILKSNDNFIIIESTEDKKNFDSYLQIQKLLFENNIDRSYHLIALGGGIIGDMTAFVASTFKRGMKLIQVPTTLLSMVDSSIGGKTGINNDYGKNMIGTFYQADKIIIDKSWLETLPMEQKINGMAEVIKMGLLLGGRLYNLVNNSNPDTWENLDEMIKLSGQGKVQIIENDVNETKGQREVLNLGHTFGHANELSNNKLHGYAISEGTLEEFYYTNYYYGYPSLDLIKDIGKIFSKWKLVPINSTFSFNKMFYFYLKNDKKTNRLITLKEIGKPAIVEFSINNIKLLKANYYKLRNFNRNHVISDYKENEKNFSAVIPSSKSETNRVLLIASFISYFADKEIKLQNILESKDTNLMIDSLAENLKVNTDKSITIEPSVFKTKNYYYLGNSGTCVRFLLPLIAFTCNKEIIFDCSEEMKKRPISPLVESLNNIGCNISYRDENNYLPLIIKPFENLKKEVYIDGTLSSQYITGLLIGYSFLFLKNSEQNFKIYLTGEKTSFGFIEMTIKILEKFGFSIEYTEDSIEIINWNRNKVPSEYIMEGDLSSASYLIGWSYINKFNLELKNIPKISTQPDFKILHKMSKYFGNLDDNNGILTFKPYNEININSSECCIDLDSSDTFLTWALLFITEKIERNKNFISKIKIDNIENQDWKECKRITNMIKNLEKLGITITRTKTGFIIPSNIFNDDTNTLENIGDNNFIMETYNDHRMAMSFSLLSMIRQDVIIENPLCVDKTFPNYWKLIQDIGLHITPIKKEFDMKKIALIGMPGSGKSTLGKLLQKKLGFDFYDLDDMIVESEDEIIQNVRQIIDENGWDYFRNKEFKSLQKVISNQTKFFTCVSTGGGIIENELSRDLLEDFVIILIRRNNLEIGERRLSDSLENLFKKRNIYYENLADFIYDNNSSEEDFIKWIKVILNNHPFPSNSTFLCKTNDEYENNIANAIELRGDLMDNYGIDKIQNTILNFNKPIIYTLRSEKEYGNFKGSKDLYEKLILNAVKHGSRLIDIEINLFDDKSKSEIIGEIFSNKNYVQILGSIHEKENINNLDCIKNMIFSIPKYDFLKFVIPENNLTEILKLEKSSFSELEFGKRSFFSEKNFVQNEISGMKFQILVYPKNNLTEILKLEKSSFSELEFGKRSFFSEKNFVQNEISGMNFVKIFDLKNNLTEILKLEKSSFSELEFGKPVFFENENFYKNDILSRDWKSKFQYPDFQINKILKLENSSFPKDEFGKRTFFENKNFCKNDIFIRDWKSKFQYPDFQINKILKLENSSFPKDQFGIWINFENENYRLKNKFLTPTRSSISHETFPGQLDCDNLLYKKFIKQNQRYIFLFGENIAHSPSAFIHNFVFDRTNVEEIYFNFEIKFDNIKIIHEIINKEYFYGASITMPYKEKIVTNPNELPVNTILKNKSEILKNKSEILKINTDITALKIAIKKYPEYEKVFIFGTGGAAIGAVIASQELNKYNINVIGRSKEKLSEIKEKYNTNVIEFNALETTIEENSIDFKNSIIINCLPPEVKFDKFINEYRKSITYIDMTYGIHNFKNKENYKNYVSGYEILYLQAAYQFKFWYDKKIHINTSDCINLYRNAMIAYLKNDYLVNTKFF